MSVQSFPTTYSLSEFSEANTSVLANQYVVAYEKEIDNGEAVGLGRGVAQNQTDAEGRLYALFGDDVDGTPLSGRVRFSVRTRQGRLVAVLNEFDMGEIQSGEAAADRPSRHPFAIQRFGARGKMMRWVAYPYVLCIEIQSDAAATIDTSASSLKADGKRAERTA